MNSWQKKKVLLAFRSMIMSQRSSVTSSRWVGQPGREPPATLTSLSRVPNSSQPLAMAFSASLFLVTLQIMVKHLPGNFSSISACSFFSVSSLMSVASTLQPSCRNRRTMALPMPPEAPVIRALLPSKRSILI